ncbi:MAG: hypothetical protein AAGF12_30445 [Myxococcota bacterium]
MPITWSPQSRLRRVHRNACEDPDAPRGTAPVGRSAVPAFRSAAARAVGCATLVGVFFGGVGPRPVLAQPEVSSSPEDATGNETEARRLFEEGTAALRANRLPEAERLLRASHERLPNIANAFNLAVALRKSGKIRAALRLLEQIDDGDFGSLEADRHEAVTAEADQARAELATLRIVTSPTVRASVRANGEPLGFVEERPLSVRVDPGAVAIEVRADGYEQATRELTLLRGDRRTVEFVLRPEVHDAPASEPEDEGGSLVWLWVGLSAAAAIGGGIALAILLQPGEADPIVDPVTGIGETLIPR